jgi:hypothetical protein
MGTTVQSRWPGLNGKNLRTRDVVVLGHRQTLAGYEAETGQLQHALGTAVGSGQAVGRQFQAVVIAARIHLTIYLTGQLWLAS